MHNYCELDNQHTKNALKKLSEKCFIQNLRYVNISLIRVRMYDKNRLTDIQEIYNNFNVVYLSIYLRIMQSLLGAITEPNPKLVGFNSLVFDLCMQQCC